MANFGIPWSAYTKIEGKLMEPPQTKIQSLMPYPEEVLNNNMFE